MARLHERCAEACGEVRRRRGGSRALDGADDGVCAVTRSTDLRQHARLLHQAHDARLQGTRPTTALRRVVSRSWDRVLSYGVAPDGRSLEDPAAPDVVERRRAESPIASVLPQLRASLTAVAEDAEHIMVVTAADGFVLWREGAVRVGRLADSLGFMPGADWTEASVGTNAIGTALAEHASVQLFSAEHFVRAQHPWTCTASPIHDPRTGEMLGVVDLSGPAPTVHPTTVALVHTAVRLAETGLWGAHETRLEGLRAIAAPMLARSSRACARRRRPRLGRRGHRPRPARARRRAPGGRGDARPRPRAPACPTASPAAGCCARPTPPARAGRACASTSTPSPRARWSRATRCGGTP